MEYTQLHTSLICAFHSTSSKGRERGFPAWQLSGKRGSRITTRHVGVRKFQLRDECAGSSGLIFLNTLHNYYPGYGWHGLKYVSESKLAVAMDFISQDKEGEYMIRFATFFKA